MANRRNMLATSIAKHVTSMDLKQQKIEEEIQKAKKRYSEQTSEKEKSKTEIKHSPNVNHSSKMEIIIDIPVMKQIENMPLLQAIPQLQNIIMDLTKSSNKKKKSNKHLVQQAITGHIPTNEDTLRVRDILVYYILVYYILVFWTPEKILK
ncbi:unnamed protein product [Rhizophagus irregularis]|nr:unnamed protein product [Rhizophagus irregularis]